MTNLDIMLDNIEETTLKIIAHFWGIENVRHVDNKLKLALKEKMTDPETVEVVYDKLSDQQRGVLQTLAGSNGYMPEFIFSRVHGEIRQMGAGMIERKRPHENPENVAEELYYKGLISRGNTLVAERLTPVIFIPSDLMSVLPMHKTGYSEGLLAGPADFEDDEMDSQWLKLDKIEPVEVDEQEVQRANTAIVDDLTTFFAFCQMNEVRVSESGLLVEDAVTALMPHMMVPEQDAERLLFIVELAKLSQFVQIDDNRIYLKRAEVRRWLQSDRSQQLEFLINRWKESTSYAELWFVPGLYTENVAGSYDAITPRKALFKMLYDYVPLNDWWQFDDFIGIVKAKNPDFHRPDGDYESLYITNRDGEYLTGFHNWGAVEGALIEFYLFGPLHWLGLCDIHDFDFTVRLNAYGRALVDDEARFPHTTDVDEPIVIHDDGLIEASRKVSRFDRFQLARFTQWDHTASLDGESYLYRVTTTSLRTAHEHGIQAEHVLAFLKRFSEDIPAAIEVLLDRSQTTSLSVMIEHRFILRVPARELLDQIYDSPKLRQYFGARLGDTSAIVLDDRWQSLANALELEGVQVDLSHLE